LYKYYIDIFLKWLFNILRHCILAWTHKLCWTIECIGTFSSSLGRKTTLQRCESSL